MLDKILPIHGKCLYLQYANNLNINIMKAIEILNAVCVECVDLEQCNVVSGETVILCGIKPYFGSPLMEGQIRKGYDYFYMYTREDQMFNSFSRADVILGYPNSAERVLLWEIEDYGGRYES